MPGGAVAAAAESISRHEAREVLIQAGFQDKEWMDNSFVGGRGGLGTVCLVGIFSALGGMLFGLDIGYISGVQEMDSFSNDLHLQKVDGKLDAVTEGLITGIFALGAVVAAFPSLISRVVDRLGRNGCIVLGGFVFCVGAALQGLAVNLTMMYLGRFIAGASVGFLSANIPIYQGEIAPPNYRGMIVSLYQLAITLGIMVAFFINTLLQKVDHGWRYCILLQLVPGLLLAIGAFAMPQSPRWLVSKGLVDESFDTLMRIRGPDDDVRTELAQICREFQREMAHGRPSWKEFFSGLNARLLWIGVLLQFLQQLCGLNMFMYYGPKIFKNIFHSENASFIFQTLNGLVNFLSTFVAIFCVDRAGRMKLLMWSFVGMAVCCVAISSVGLACFTPDGNDGGQCGDWAKGALAGFIFLFIFNFAYGCGPVVWIYCAEIYSMKYRTKANGLTTDANWVGNFVIGFLPPMLLDNLHFHTYWIFAAINVVGAVTCCRLPETKGMSLEDIQTMFEERFYGNAAVEGQASGSSPASNGQVSPTVANA